MMRRSFSFFKKIVYYALMVVVCFEVSLWIIGYRPYSNHDYKVEATPKNAFVGDSRYGFRCNPGIYKVVLNDKIEFNTTHLPDGTRKVFQPNSYRTKGKIAFLGCSFTYGYGVNDDQTFVSNLQRSFPNWDLVNYGTPGFGTVQSYLQLQELVKNDSLNSVVLVFSSFHFERNVLSQDYRSNLKIGFRNSSKDVDARMSDAKIPYVSDKTLKVEWADWNEMYANFYFRNYFATANWLQNNIDKFKDRNLEAIKITKNLFYEMSRICSENDIAFQIIFLDDSEDTKMMKGKEGIPNSFDVKFDFKNLSYTNLPYDSHPNAKGHAIIANRIHPVLSRMLNDHE